MSIRGRGRLWTEGEKFQILRYATEGAEALAEKLGRSISSVKTMAQNMNTTKTYNKKAVIEECTPVLFCNDCVYDRKECGKQVQDCLSEEDADIYNKFHKVVGAEGSKDKVTIIWKKKKRKKKVEKVATLPFNM